MRATVAVTLLLLALLGASDGSASTDGPCSSSSVVLGSVRAIGPRAGVGWGTCAPHFFTNGGDAAGQVARIRWTHWGAPTATGEGVTWLDTNAGAGLGPVKIELRASGIGRCTSRGKAAYRRLQFRAPNRVGGPVGPWRSWDMAGASPRRTICNAY